MQDDLEIMAGSDGVSVHSGFPNPAADQRGRQTGLALDLNRLLIKHPSSTYLFRIAGHHAAQEGIYDGDVAVVDRLPAARDSDLVVVWQDQALRLCRRHRLLPGDDVWGVVTAVIHQYR